MLLWGHRRGSHELRVHHQPQFDGQMEMLLKRHCPNLLISGTTDNYKKCLGLAMNYGVLAPTKSSSIRLNSKDLESSCICGRCIVKFWHFD